MDRGHEPGDMQCVFVTKFYENSSGFSVRLCKLPPDIVAGYAITFYRYGCHDY